MKKDAPASARRAQAWLCKEPRAQRNHAPLWAQAIPWSPDFGSGMCHGGSTQGPKTLLCVPHTAWILAPAFAALPPEPGTRAGRRSGRAHPVLAARDTWVQAVHSPAAQTLSLEGPWASACGSLACSKASARWCRRGGMASGATAPCSSHGGTCAAHGANVVVASRQAPQGTRASNRVPVSCAARLTKPGRRAAASMSSEAKQAVNRDNARCGPVVMGVSLGWCEEARGNPSSHLGETSTFHGNSIGYRFMRMPPMGHASGRLGRWAAS